jgi:hypothetical protein
MRAKIGNVLHQLLAYCHPHVKHVITQTIDQSNLQDESDGLDPQQMHIRSQAVRIQRGECVDQVTALLPDAR